MFRGGDGSVTGVRGVSGEEVDDIGAVMTDRAGNRVVKGTHGDHVEILVHGLADGIEEHGDKAIHLFRGGERGLQLVHRDREGNLEGDMGVEVFSVHIGAVEDVGIVGGSIGESPFLVDLGDREFDIHFAHDGAIFPSVADEFGEPTIVGPIDKNHFADSID